MKNIFSKFANLKPEKQERILNAAMKEFSIKGFKNASTDEIVKEASISKGSLFHYFKNKKELFLFLYDYTIDIYLKEFFGRIDLNERDIFKRWRQLILIKLTLIHQYPDMFDFIRIAYFEDEAEIKKGLDARNKELISMGFKKILADIDFSKFKKDIDVNKAVNAIVWTLEGFAVKEQEKIKSSSLKEIDFDEMLVDLDQYFELLKKSFYECVDLDLQNTTIKT